MTRKSGLVVFSALVVLAVGLLVTSTHADEIDMPGHADNANAARPMVFPAWTYYAEIIEHAILIILPIGAIAALAARYRKDSHLRKPVVWMAAGLSVLAVGQALTNMQHFLMFPFGIFTAIVHHGLLVAGIAIMIFAFFGLLAARKGAESAAKSAESAPEGGAGGKGTASEG